MPYIRKNGMISWEENPAIDGTDWEYVGESLSGIPHTSDQVSGYKPGESVNTYPGSVPGANASGSGMTSGSYSMTGNNSFYGPGIDVMGYSSGSGNSGRYAPQLSVTTLDFSKYGTGSSVKNATADASRYQQGSNVAGFDTGAAAAAATPDYGLNYDPGAAGKAYQAAMEKIGQDLGERPVYDGRYDRMLDESYNAIVNRDPFTWSPDTDQFYKDYEQRYTQLGQRAMKDTMGQAAALTGGYGNTYAERAGQDAYNEWMDALMEKSVQLEQRAYDRWRDAGDQMVQNFGLLSSLRDNDYGMYRDSVSDYNYNLALLQAYEADNYNRAVYDNNLRIQAEQTGYGRARDQLSDLRYNDETEYGRWRDQLSDQMYIDQTDYDRYRDLVSDERYIDQLGYDRWRDMVSDDRYNAEWAYKQQRDAIADQQWADELGYKYDAMYNSGSGSGSGSSGRSSGSGGSYGGGGYGGYDDYGYDYGGYGSATDWAYNTPSYANDGYTNGLNFDAFGNAFQSTVADQAAQQYLEDSLVYDGIVKYAPTGSGSGSRSSGSGNSGSQKLVINPTTGEVSPYSGSSSYYYDPASGMLIKK